METNYLHSAITSKIIKAFYAVYNKLGFGFLEKVYQNALIIELKKSELNCRVQEAIKVYYDDQEVGLYFADIIVDDKVILELKAGDNLCEEHEAQLVNYLRATDIEVGLLLNFGIKAQCKRRVLTSDYKRRNDHEQQ